MTRQAQHDAAPATSTRRASADSRRTTDQCAIGVLTLDGILADPMVQSLMHRDGTDAAAIRRLWEHVACARCAGLLKLEQPGGLNQVTLAHRLDVAPITIARLLDRLETAGLVSRLPDPNDRRAHILTPTAKARPLIARIREVVRTIQKENWLGLSNAETVQLDALLGRIQSNLLIGTNRQTSADLAGNSEHA
jgi:DNA-binding MarR family transcriptional regulator